MFGRCHQSVKYSVISPDGSEFKELVAGDVYQVSCGIFVVSWTYHTDEQF